MRGEHGKNAAPTNNTYGDQFRQNYQSFTSSKFAYVTTCSFLFDKVVNWISSLCFCHFLTFYRLNKQWITTGLHSCFLFVSSTAFTQQLCFFCAINSQVNNNFELLTRVFSCRMWMSSCQKATLLFFWTFAPRTKASTNHDGWLDVTSICYNNNINNGWISISTQYNNLQAII